MPADVLASTHLNALCDVSPDRRPGSPGNDAAVGYAALQLRELGWQVAEQTFDVMDWSGSAGSATVGRDRWTVVPSPYAKGAELSRPLVVVRDMDQLSGAAREGELTGRVVLLLGDLAGEPLTPMDYLFYGDPAHAELLGLLVDARPSVVLAGTGTAPRTAGALEPFPLIEDGAFPIPTGNLTVANGEALAAHAGQRVRVDMSARRWPSTARNVIARRGPAGARLVVCAHVDGKPGSPGAVDNASGVAVLLLLARLLPVELAGGIGVELFVVNGEDYYSAAGEKAYLEAYGDTLDDVVLVLNVDGVGFRVGGTAYSEYEVPSDLSAVVRPALTGSTARAARLSPGPAWFSSDHMVFVQRGRPALAFTSEHLDTVLADVAHSPHDTPAQVDITLLVGLSEVLAEVVETVGRSRA